ncbi:hypothetical protein H9P43_004408 [Blastocladiella emersonii ATCC 22665]|nr:hypothetical protein H9P43_004408 [Blastocladiella emersonii ATCC 22665]
MNLLKKLLRSTPSTPAAAAAPAPAADSELAGPSGGDDERTDSPADEIESETLAQRVPPVEEVVVGSAVKVDREAEAAAEAAEMAAAIEAVELAEAEAAARPPVYTASSGAVVVSLHGFDKLCISGVQDADERAALKWCLRTHWPRGFYAYSHRNTKFSNHCDMYLLECRLKGEPWRSTGETGVAARALLAALFRTFLTLGWRVALTTDVSKRERSKDSYVLLRAAPITFSDDSDVFTVSFKGRASLRIQGAPDKAICVVRDTIAKYWPYRTRGPFAYYGAREFILANDPWWPSSTGKAVKAQFVVGQLTAALHSNDYMVYTSVDISASESGETDTWIVVKGLPLVPWPGQ